MQKIAEVARNHAPLGINVPNYFVEAIESGQYKYALQVCTKTLKKAKAPADVAQLTVT
jgi:hypothetical protein